MKPASRWTGGNSIRLLENGENYFPAVFDAIDAARDEIILETFILFEDKIGKQLHGLLLAAARRGVRIDMLIDGYGSSELTPPYIDALTQAGVRLRVFDPARRVMGLRFNVLHRMHRKIVVVDAQRAFVGGINFSFDHMRDFGPEAKQDYAVEVHGPIVAQIHRFVRASADQSGAREAHAAEAEHPVAPRHESTGRAEAIFVTRDNQWHRNGIERQYRAAIRAARERVVLANAYFFPGYRLLRQLRRAARRGVQVTLILQGEPDMPIAKMAARLLYGYLQIAGVQIYEYCERPLHGKVAVVDADWSTVGSSNLDPTSLTLNLEANLVIRDKAFARHLGERLQYLITNQCRAIEPEATGPTFPFWGPVRSFLLFHLLSGYSRWLNWLPQRAAKIRRVGKAAVEAGASGQGSADEAE